MRKQTLASAVSLTALGLLMVFAGVPEAQALAVGSFERTLQVSGPVEMEVTTGSGDIEVHTGPANSVQISGRIKSNNWFSNQEEKIRKIEAHPPIEQSGNTIRIGHLSDPELRHGISISYRVTVPVATRLTSHTGSGDLRLEGIHGPADLHSGSGNVTARNIGSEVQANTGSGDVQLENVKGGVHAEAGSGDVKASGIGGAFDGRSGSGNIRLEQTAPGDVHVETGSGNVELRGVHGSLNARTGSGDMEVDGVPTGEWRLHAGSGNITVRVPSEAAFDVDAESNSGTISLNHPVTVQGRIERRQVHGKVRGGGSLLEARTGSGDIEIN
ncbi:MAG TPA: DUF4097 family beta strand repeat-containing protein [Terriglobales bacterium]|nr:DUF4097 family beta strand repeat-containing protein [Terriglobales bacterium]